MPTTLKSSAHAVLSMSSVEDCMRDVASWTKSNRFQLNSSTTEVTWCATSRRHHHLPASALSVDGVVVDLGTSVRDLGINIDAPGGH